MQTAEQAYNFAADLYSLAFLLTGRSELSLEVVIETLDAQDDTELFFLPPARARLRESAIAKALAAVCYELALSARQTASQRLAQKDMPPSTWSLDPHTSRLQIESALLAIKIFPRCALLLTVFEGFSLEAAAAFLNCDPDLVLKGRMPALWELTRHLARMQGWNCASSSVNPSAHFAETIIGTSDDATLPNGDPSCESNSTPLLSDS